MPACAVVMSFDAFAMHNLRREMTMVLDALQQGVGGNGMAKTTSIPTSMSFGNFSVAQNLNMMGATPSSSPPSSTSRAITIQRNDSLRHHGRTDSGENVGMWLSESVNQNDSY